MANNNPFPLPGRRSLELRVASWSDTARTVEVVFSTGGRVPRFDPARGIPVEEELSMAPGAVRLDRLNAGAPVLNTHQQGQLGDQIGVVVPGSARIDGGLGIATLKLSERDEVAGIVKDIAAGVIRNISIGYRVNAFEIEEQTGAVPLYRATDWEPFEISFVPVPADFRAQVRAVAPTNEDLMMPVTGNSPRALTAKSVVTRCQDAGLPAHFTAEILDMHARSPLTEDELFAEIGPRWAARDTARGIQRGGSGRYLDLGDNSDRVRDGLEDALYARLSGKSPEAHGRDFMGLSLSRMAAECLASRGDNVRGLSAGEVLTRAMMSTSDFPHLMSSAFNRYLLDHYEAAGSAIKQVARKRTAQDFRALHGVRVESGSLLSEVREGGEVTRGTLADSTESYRVATYARIFAVSRQALINDDLGAFSDMLRLLARAAAETEAQLLADMLTANSGAGVTLSDTHPLFYAARRNKAGTASKIDIPNLSLGRQALREQVNDDGTPVNATARYLLTGPTKETEAESVLAALAPSKVGDVNPFSGKLELLVDPRLSGNPWWLFADPGAFPVLEYAYLGHQEGPQIEMRQGWDTMGTEWRVTLDFGCGAVGWRGSYLNAGSGS